MKMIVLFLSSLLLLACEKNESFAKEQGGLPKTFLALGDSYTSGDSVPAEERFAVQTVKMINASGKKFAEPEIIAHGGWTTTNLLQAIQRNPPKRSKFDVVTLLIGVNNQFQGRSKEEYENEFATLLNKAIQYAGNRKDHVIVLSIPDYGVTPFAKNHNPTKIAKEIDEFNTINKKISKSKNVHYLEITTLTRMAEKDATQTAPDGLHPSAKAYKAWSEKLATLIQSII